MFGAFLRYLGRNTPLAADQLDRLRHFALLHKTQIGLLALTHGLMTGEQIDLVLKRQSQSEERFGEAAISLGILTEDQVWQLLEVQDLAHIVDAVQHAVLRGWLSAPQAMTLMGECLANEARAAAVSVAMESGRDT